MVTGINSLNIARWLPSSPTVARAMKQFSANYPIASKILVREELIKGAIVTRFLVGMARIHVNIPSSEKKLELTRAQKYQSFLERVLIEIVNIPVQVATMFFTQEFVARALEKGQLCATPTVAEISKLAERHFGKGEYKSGQISAIAKAFSEHYGDKKFLIARKLYERNALYSKISPLRNSVLQNLVKNRAIGASTFDTVNKVKQLTDATLGYYFRKVSGASSLALLSGMLTGAIVSGYVLQMFNDHVFSTKIAPAILRFFGILPKQDKNQAAPVNIGEMPAIYDRTFII